MSQRHRHVEARILSSRTMKAADNATIERWGIPGVVLMERAALACRLTANELVPERDQKRRVAVLVGPGNNGGDGSALARLLSLDGWLATIILATDRGRITGDALVELDAAERFGVGVVSHESSSARERLLDADLWVDALLGIGTTTPPRGAIAAALGLANTCASERDSRPRILAVDLPSGVNSDNGVVFTGALPADVTVTFGHRKWCHCLPPGFARCGRVVVSDIGLPPESIPDSDEVGEYVTLDLARRLYRPLPVSAHKGNAGRVLVIAGSESMPGAAALVCGAAMRSGAGLVYLYAPASVRNLVIGANPEVVGVAHDDRLDALLRSCESIVAGPGWEDTEDSTRLLERVLTRSSRNTLVLDATALRSLRRLETSPQRSDGPLILTPHPGELAALLECDTPDVVESLRESASLASSRFRAVVVAKTAGALIWNERARFVPAGSPGMATAGSGDVLAGIIGALAARHDAGRAATLGAFLHARAGASAAGAAAETLTARRIINGLDAAFAELTVPKPNPAC